MRNATIALSIAVAAAMIAVLPAWGKGSGASSISLVIPTAGQAASPSNPTFGQQVTFNESTSATAFPWVDTKCTQNGTVVYEQWAGFFSTYTGSQMFTLGPTQLWTGGAATCTASLVSFDRNGSPKTLATTSFNVSG